MGLGTAFRAFFVALGSSERATAIRRALDEDASKLPAPKAEPQKVEKIPAVSPGRSEALDFLAALQREARLVDLVSEPLDAYSDAQIGAAARPCLKQAGQVISRMFQLTPISDASEGASIPMPETWSPMRYQVIGGKSVSPQQSVRVVHPGWQASVCKVPQWTGDKQDAMIVAAAQVEVAS
jgi:hypothetical protein